MTTKFALLAGALVATTMAMVSQGSAERPSLAGPTPSLEQIVERWRAKDKQALHNWAASGRSLGAMLSAYFLQDLGSPSAVQLFLNNYPRDEQSLYWLYSSDDVWEAACGPPHGPCVPEGDSLLLSKLAREGKREAIDLYLDSWMINTDASVAEAFC